MIELCRSNGCRNEPARAGLCWTHVKRRQLDRPMDPEVRRHYQDRQEMLWEAIFSALEVSPTDDEGWERARARVRMAAIRYAHGESASE